MMRLSVILFAALAVSPASAQGLEGLLGQFQDKAKATAFDTAIQSQAPGLSGLTQGLSDSQKAQLFDLGVDNAGTIGQVAAGASALGAVSGVTAPAYPQPVAPAPAYGTVAPAYPQPVAPAPAYGQGQTTANDALINGVIQLGLGALGN